MRRPAIALTVATAILATGCTSREGQLQVSELEADNARLELKLEERDSKVLELENQIDLLRGENRLLREQLELGRSSTSGAPLTAVEPSGSTASGALPSVADAEAEAAAAAAPTGDWVLVLASVGSGHADAERNNYQAAADQLNSRHGGSLGSRFGLRTPRSGGLQLVYGTAGSEFGVTKADIAKAKAALSGTYADAYALNIR
jgi:TolA-binding protein